MVTTFDDHAQRGPSLDDFHIRSGLGLDPHIRTSLLQKAGLRTSQNAATIKQYLATNCEAALEAEARETALASETERRFRDALNANRLDGDWDAAEGNPSEILMLAGRVHDVIVVKQTQEGVDEPGWDVPEACAVSSGTPTLVVPFEGSFPSIGERLLIAWNGSQQAAAAVHGAMPLIHRESGGMPAALEVMMFSRYHFASSAQRISRSCPALGAVQGILAKSKHSSFHQIAAAIAVLLPVECPDRTVTRAPG